MKKGIIILLVILTTILFACESEDQSNATINPSTINISENVKVEVDPRIELLTIIQYLADYELITPFNLDYKKDVDEFFKEYKNHKAVTQFKELSKRGFVAGGPVNYILNCTSLPELEVSENISYSQKELIVGVEDINGFRESMKSFYNETNFKEFYSQHKELYQEMLTSYTKDNNLIELYIDSLENYTGKNQKSYNIILSPLIHEGGFSPSLNEENDKYDTYILLGSTIPPEIYKKFDNDYEKAKKFSDTASAFKLREMLMIHEFTHTHLRSMEEEPYLHTINNKEPKNQEYLNDFSKVGYNTWDSIVNEYFVRSITARILFLEDEKEEYKRALNNDKKSGFTHIESLIEKLKEYENNRDKYKQIEDFYPELLNILVKQYN